jgi:glycosyltransferase involved in cell wall biosynthesis
MPRLLILSNSHPAVSHGGSELAAWRLFEQFRARPGWETWLLGCTREAGALRPGAAIGQPFSEREFLYAAGGFDWFKFANTDESFPRAFEEMLGELRPDILHFHHYMNFGVEAFLIARRVLPDVRIVLTLHEFGAICNHMGQMVTKPGLTLCHAASPRACNRCFPDIARADFFLRETWLKRFFDLVDQFIAPSRFLAERFIAWGIPAAKMAVIDNVTAEPAPGPTTPRPPDGLLRIGFFGQITPLKGLSVLLAAAALLDRDDAPISFDIHGDYSSQQPEFQAEIRAALAGAGANIRFHGPYDNDRVDSLMRGCDAILVPSIWWENAPVVIEEALRNRRPVICPDIGGMAEKVRAGQDGLHFRVGNALALANLLRQLAADRTPLEALQGTMRRPATAKEVTAAHAALYKQGSGAFLKKSAQKTSSVGVRAVGSGVCG